MASMPGNDDSSGSGFRKFFLLIILFLLFLLALQIMGVKVVNRTEKEELIENPHPGY